LSRKATILARSRSLREGVIWVHPTQERAGLRPGIF
jgi:hypothetical protein